MRSITCANDDDDLRSEKLAVFRAHAAPWQATPPGGPIKNEKDKWKKIYKKTTDICQWFFFNYDTYYFTKEYNDFSVHDTNV